MTACSRPAELRLGQGPLRRRHIEPRRTASRCRSTRDLELPELPPLAETAPCSRGRRSCATSRRRSGTSRRGMPSDAAQTIPLRGPGTCQARSSRSAPVSAAPIRPSRARTNREALRPDPYSWKRSWESILERWSGLRDHPWTLAASGKRGYRVLDSRYFGVPQRRRRVYVDGAVADGDPRAAAERRGEVLAVGTRCPRHPATRGEAREDVAVASLSGLGSDGPDDNDGQGGRLVTAPLMSARAAEARTRCAPVHRRRPHRLQRTRRARGRGRAHVGCRRTARAGRAARATRSSTAARRCAPHPTECERRQALPAADAARRHPRLGRYAALGRRYRDRRGAVPQEADRVRLAESIWLRG